MVVNLTQSEPFNTHYFIRSMVLWVFFRLKITCIHFNLCLVIPSNLKY